MTAALLGQAFPPVEHVVGRALRSPLGALAERPWLDPVGVYALRRWYLPLARLAAAAAQADGSPARLLDDAGIFGGGRPLAAAARSALARADAARRAIGDASRHWDEALFGSAMGSAHGGDLAAIDAARIASWLRFRSPATRMGDDAFARVTEPCDAAEAPTIVAVNGICIDIDHLDGGVDVATSLAALGWRVIELVAPWHGRRAPAGWYGGEPFFGTAPLGALDLLDAAVREVAVLVGWTRRFDRPVAVAGTSFGSLVCQIVASRSDGWPAALRPDGALLIAHSGRLEPVMLGGALTAGLGLGAALSRARWRPEDLRAWLPLLDPPDRCTIDPVRVVSVVGVSLKKKPARGGNALCDCWGVPNANRVV